MDSRSQVTRARAITDGAHGVHGARGAHGAHGPEGLQDARATKAPAPGAPNGEPPESLPPESAIVGSHQPGRIRTPPPLDPTVSPASSSLVAATILSIRRSRPILASQSLYEDIAPLRPFEGRALRAYVTGGLALVVGGVVLAVAAPSVGARVCGAGASATGAVLAALVRARHGYADRARLGVVAGMVGLVVVAAAVAQLSGAVSPPLGAPLARGLGAVALAAPLFLRATYRSMRRVRIAVGLGAALFALAALSLGWGAGWTDVDALMLRGEALAMVAVAALSLLAFMNEQTTAGCVAWGTATLFVGLGAVVIDAARAALATNASLPAVVGIAGCGVVALASLSLATLGTYQLVALDLGPRARARVQGRPSFVPSVPPGPRSEEDEPERPDES